MLICDTHIHSHRSFVGDKNMTLENIAEKSFDLGINVAGVTDHLMKVQDINDLKITKEDILNFRKNNHKTSVLFGVEVCEVSSDGSTLLTKELAQEMNFDLIIGGVHETHMPKDASLYDMAVMQHKHHLMMMENPLIEILVHPWWLDKGEFERLNIEWPNNMSFIPKELTIELAKASKKTNTYIEISTMSGLCNKDVSEKFRNDQIEYFKLLNDNGALFAIGTDTHELSEMETFNAARDLINKIGIDEKKNVATKIKHIEGEGQ